MLVSLSVVVVVVVVGETVSIGRSPRPNPSVKQYVVVCEYFDKLIIISNLYVHHKMIEPETSDHLPSWTTDPKVATKIQMGTTGIAAMGLMTIPELFKQRAEEFSQKTALVYEDAFHTWKSVTYKQYYSKVEHISKVFIKLGLLPRHSVGILGPNCPEWFYSELAAISAGGTAAGIYTTNSAEAVYHVLEKAQANIVVVDDTAQLEKVLAVRRRLPLLKAIVQIQAPFAAPEMDGCSYYRWPELENMDVSSADLEEEYQRRLAKIKVNEAAVLIFTVSDSPF